MAVGYMLVTCLIAGGIAWVLSLITERHTDHVRSKIVDLWHRSLEDSPEAVERPEGRRVLPGATICLGSTDPVVQEAHRE